jgi:GTP-binding protein
MKRQRLPMVAVVGRPNVGKSTFFNRAIGRAEAVVDDLPGVTRDRREADCAWNGVPFRIVDTGGLVPGTEDSMEAAILTQAHLALEEADVILFLVDVREGLTSLDRDIAEQLRPRSAKVLLVANKVESTRQEELVGEAAELGLGEAMQISGQHGRGIGELLDAVVERLPKRVIREEETPPIHVALLGRPNVGKSSLANRLLGEERMIVHPVAGTTRDAIDIPFRFDGTEFVLVDTAGLRRRSKVSDGVEYYSTVRTQRSLKRCDVALLVLDMSEPITTQDTHIAMMILEAGKSAVLLANKWDLVTKLTGTAAAYTRTIEEAFPMLPGTPILFVSALSGQRVSHIPALVRTLYEERNKSVATSVLNQLLKEATDRKQPPVTKRGKALKLYYATQVTTGPPIFAIFANEPDEIPESYRSYLRNHFRERLEMTATPLRLDFRARRR